MNVTLAGLFGWLFPAEVLISEIADPSNPTLRIKYFPTAKVGSILDVACKDIVFDEAVVFGSTGDYFKVGAHQSEWSEVLKRANNITYITTKPGAELINKLAEFKANSKNVELHQLSIDDIKDAVVSIGADKKWTLPNIQLSRHREKHHWILFKNKEKISGIWVEGEHSELSPEAKNCYMYSYDENDVQDDISSSYQQFTAAYLDRARPVDLVVPAQ